MISCQRDAFDLPREQAYLNCAYQGPLANNVHEVALEQLAQRQRPWLIGKPHFFDPPQRLRETFARLIGSSEPDRVALMPSASYGLSQVAHNCGVEKGHKIILMAEQFPSNYYTWKRLADEAEAKLEMIGSGRPFDLDYNEAVLEAIDSSCRVVSMAHIHWADGTLYDLEAISRRCKEVGALLIVDGTQSVGALPFDLSAVKPDALICAAYKWLLGPYGAALGWFGPAFDGGTPIEENWINRRDSDQFAALVNYEPEYQEAAARYNVGQTSNFIYVPMIDRAIQNILSWGVANIQEYCRELFAEASQELEGLGCEIASGEKRAHHLFGIRYSSELFDADKLAAALQEKQVYLSKRGDALRVSPHLYNDAEDVSKLVACFELARKKQLH